MRIRLVLNFIAIYIHLSACTQQSENRNEETSSQLNEKSIDSIYERFEDIAYNNKEQYITNPDSFLLQLKVAPSTYYQKELFTYGLIFIGYALMENGDIHESIKYYEKAYNTAKESNINIDDNTNIIVKPLSNLYTRINDTEKAINLLQNTIQQNSDPSENIGLNNNLANAYLYNNQIVKAEVILLENINKASNSKQKALLYNSLASIYNEKTDRTNSIKYNQLAIAAFEKDSLQNDTLLWYLSALGLHSQLNNNTLATQKALKIANLHFPKTQNRLKAKLIAIEAKVLQQSNHPDVLNKNNEIIRLFKAEKLNNTLDYTYTKALLGKATYFKQNKQIDSSLFYYELGIENDFKTQQLITSSNDQLRNNTNNKKIIEELIELISSDQKLKNDPKVLKSLLWCIELSKARLLINEINRSDQWSNSNINTKSAVQKIQSLYQQKDESNDDSKKRTIQTKIDNLLIEFQLSEKYFESIRFVPNKEIFYTHLNRSETDYYAYHINLDNSLTIIHKKNNNLELFIKNDSLLLNRIEEFKHDYFSNSPDNYNNNPKAYIQRSQLLTKELLPHLNAKNVFVSLDGNLYGLPFDALFQDDFLIYKHNFAYLNSFLLFNILHVQNDEKKTSLSLLFRAEYSSPLPSLNFVKKEIDNISQNYQAERIGPDKQTDSILKEHFAQSNIIHIAAHTILDSTEAPIIFLKHPISTDQIRYFEIKSPLVFLSACNTGTGESLTSEGTESIQRVFLSKNVPSVISTYWFANDETMLNITSNFYDQLNLNNNPIIALAEAKRNYLSNANTQLQNPWYWANINYSGIGNKIGLKKESPNLLYFALAVGLILSLYLIRRLWLNRSFKNIS